MIQLGLPKLCKAVLDNYYDKVNTLEQDTGGSPAVGYKKSYNVTDTKGLCKEHKFKKSEITMEVGGWVQVSLGKTSFDGGWVGAWVG